MQKYKYTIYDSGEVVVSLDDIEVARSALSELGPHAYIQFNEAGIEDYNKCKEYRARIEDLQIDYELTEEDDWLPIMLEEENLHEAIAELGGVC